MFLIDAPEEADGALAREVIDDRAWAAVSEDGDLLARGCPRVIRMDSSGHFYQVILEDVLAHVGTAMDEVRLVPAVCTACHILLTSFAFFRLALFSLCSFKRSVFWQDATTQHLLVALHSPARCRRIDAWGRWRR